MKIGPPVRPGRRIEKKRTGQDRTGQSKKSQRRYILPIWGEAPTEPIFTKICIVIAVHNVITYANFWAEIFRGYDFTGGRISRFPIDSFMGLTTVQRYCAACDSSPEKVGSGKAVGFTRCSSTTVIPEYGSQNNDTSDVPHIWMLLPHTHTMNKRLRAVLLPIATSCVRCRTVPVWSNYIRAFYCSWDTVRHWSKIANFSYPTYT